MTEEKPHHLFDPADPAALAFTTAIDRRSGSRAVPLQVLGLGLSRTGTTSLRQALIELGFGDCYHYSTILQENPLDQQIWLDALRCKFEPESTGHRTFGRKDWDALLGHCGSVTDAPCNIFWQELHTAYPDAKVVVTVRDSPQQWLQSFKSTVYTITQELMNDSAIAANLNPLTLEFFKVFTRYSPIFSRIDRDTKTGEHTALEYYSDHLSELQRSIPSDRLLVFNVKEGWEPLCSFLGVEAPERPFPRRNDQDTFWSNTNAFKALMG